MAELRITEHRTGQSGQRLVYVTWQDGAAHREAVATLDPGPDAGYGERIRWYLEDYPEFPADPAPVLAAAAEARLAEIGMDLFNRLFAGGDAAGIWERARDQLGQVRVEVATDPATGPDLAWELLRDPGRDTAVALGAAAFVRSHRHAERDPVLPEPAGDRMRVLLVIARPAGSDDVPFRSVAARLVRGGADQMPGLDLDVLRPATFPRLAEVLRAAHSAGRPYHVVHFDGHGSWLDLEYLGITPGGTDRAVRQYGYGVSVAGPVRTGRHGYLLFEDPGGEANQCLVDGPTLGRLLAATGVPVLVLNSSRSAYTEASDEPGEVPEAAGGEGEHGLTGDVHPRIRAYGSLAAEVTNAGVPGVVAMRHVVYVVTAAQFVTDLYAHLLAGKSLGEAATAARKALAADPVRQIGPVPVTLQDWAVPVVYEAAPLVLLRPPERLAPLIALTPASSGAGQEIGTDRVPQPPEAGFFGRDETLLALDRAFDTHPVVLLHALAGAGKSATAAEFARWYHATGGLDWPEQPEWPGAVLWSSFEHHLTADRVIGTAGDFFAPLLEGAGIAWPAVTDPAQRRDIVMQVLAQVPVLWVWDNVEPVTGFPEGAASDWTTAEQDDLAALLRELAQGTRCKVLVTSRRDEDHWLGGLPTRVRLPPMPIRESVQLAAALVGRHGHSLGAADWRPLLRYAGGNPLTITVVIGQALRGGLTTTEAIEGFVAALQAGEAQPEAGEDAALGRSRSLAASLSYGFAEAFTEAERARLAVLHLFRDFADADVLHAMGDRETLGEYAVPELAGLDRDAVIGLLDRAAGIGLLESPGGGYYRIHPALPWHFTTLFAASYGPADSPSAQGATRAYTRVLGELGDYYHYQAGEGLASEVVPVLGAEEANLRHALSLARADGLWPAAAGCLQGLSVLYGRTGRDGEWARLVSAVTPDFTDPATEGPLPGRDDEWSIVTGYRARLAAAARDWPAASTLQSTRIAWHRDRAAAALGVPAGSLTAEQRNRIRNLAGSLGELGNVLLVQEDPGCLQYFQEALTLNQQVSDQAGEAQVAGSLGNAYVIVPQLRDVDHAEHWFRHSLGLRPDRDRLGRSQDLGSLGAVALERFDDALAAGEAEPVLLQHLNAALDGYQQALDLMPADDHEQRAIVENQLGTIYKRARDTRHALRHYQQAIRHHEARSDSYGAGQSRHNVAILLAEDDETGDALPYAHAALHNYQQAGRGAARDAADAERLIADLEQHSH